MTIPIEVTGTLNPHTGVLRVDAQSSYPVGGGTGHETDEITGELRGF